MIFLIDKCMQGYYRFYYNVLTNSPDTSHFVKLSVTWIVM
jgi:hypothetical protein